MGVRDENKIKLFIWLIIGMIDIIFLGIGALTFLVLGIFSLSNYDGLNQTLQSKGYDEIPGEEAGLARLVLMIGTVFCLIVFGKRLHKQV